jgi:hypothetical protein
LNSQLPTVERERDRIHGCIDTRVSYPKKNEIPVRKAATKKRVAAVVAFVTPRPELWSVPVFF